MSARNRFSRGVPDQYPMEHIMIPGDVPAGATSAMDWLHPPGPPQPPNLSMVPPPWLNRDDIVGHRPVGAAACLGYQGESAPSREELTRLHHVRDAELAPFLPQGVSGAREIREIPSGNVKPQDASKEPVNKQVFRKQFKKTQMCRFFQRSACRKGEFCEFAHGPQELTQPPDLRRTSLCKAFMEGCCPESADSCRFAHGIAMLRRTPGFEKVVNKEPQEKDMAAAFDYESQLHLHQMLRHQQQEQAEMRQVIEEQRRKISELKMQQERLQQAQLASMQPRLPGDMDYVPSPLEAPIFRNQPPILPNLVGAALPPPEAQQFKSIPL